MLNQTPTTAIARIVLLAGILLAFAFLASRSFFPVFAQGGPEEIEFYENSEDDVAVFTATDPDGDTITWEATGPDAADFSITDGVLTFNNSPSYESPTDRADAPTEAVQSDNMYHVTVAANDGTVTTNTEVIVTVKNVEEAGTVTMSGVQPKEDVELIGTLTDPDGKVGDTLPLILTGQNPDNDLSTESTTEWQWATSTDAMGPWNDIKDATINRYTPGEGDVGVYLRVTVTYMDRSGVDDPDTFDVDESLDPQLEFTFGDLPVLRVEYVNDPPVFKDADGEGLTATTKKVAENSPEGTDVGKPVQATDFGEDGRTPELLTYTLEGLNEDLFTIQNDNPSTASVNEGGQIKVGANTPLDHEDSTQNGYEVAVKATDPSGQSDTINVTIDVTDVNEAPEITVGQAVIEVDENVAITTRLGTSPYAATDPEGEHLFNAEKPLKWAVEGTDRSRFNINDDGELMFKELPNYEAKRDSNSDNKYSVTVKVTDSGGMSDTRAVVVEVVDVDEGDTVLTLSHRPAVGVVLTASFSDPDGGRANEKWTWATSSPNIIPNATRSIYTPKAADANETLTVTVTYDDKFGPKSLTEESTLLPVLSEDPSDRNTAPTFAKDSETLEVSEGAKAGDPVDSPITATDTHHNSDLIYELSNPNSGHARFFNIGRTSGQITVGDGTELNREKDDTYTVTVRAKDPFGKPDTIRVTINVTDVPEGPFITEDDATIRIDYAEDRTDEVHTFEATDPEDDDAGNDLTWSLSTGADITQFEIGERDGVLSFKQTPSYEAAAADKVYKVTVQVADNTNPTPRTDTQDVEVTVTDVEEDGTITLPNLQPKQTIQLQAMLDDPDGGSDNNLPLLPGDSNLTAETEVKWQWARSRNKRDWTEIAMAAASSYTPVKDDVGHYLRVTAKYTDRRSEAGDDPKTAEEITANVVQAKGLRERSLRNSRIRTL